AEGEGLRLFRENYLEVSQNGAPPAVYPYVFVAPSNTGLHSGHDLDRDGVATKEPGSREYGGDAFGYGEFPGQFAMAVLSKFPIDEENARTFQTFLWKDMPGAMIPDDAAAPAPADWYAPEALADFRLSSKNHWDIPILVDGARVHLLASHPTPPGFDGPEDRNGKRNHDENRFWADYISGEGDYIYDDNGGRGGLTPGARFVIMGDLNADPHDGGAVEGAIGQLLNAPEIAAAPAPQSAGGAAQSASQAGANLAHAGPAVEDTSDFNDDPEKGVGNLHLDYVLPSKFGLKTARSGVFWPAPGEAHYDLVGPGYPVESSDHRLVWRDLVILQEE
ncbi:MAG: endonuclease/exonuclease/phosphatase family protein, partial [Parvularculaceae bacterium]